MREESRRCELLVDSTTCIHLINFEPRLRRLVASCRVDAADFCMKVEVQFPKGFPLQRAKLMMPEEPVAGQIFEEGKRCEIERNWIISNGKHELIQFICYYQFLFKDFIHEKLVFDEGYRSSGCAVMIQQEVKIGRSIQINVFVKIIS